MARNCENMTVLLNEKDWILTTLAIIGSGIAGRSLLYTLAKEKKSFDKITLLSSDDITAPCTFSSTAVVAPRGLSRGHSQLGDLLLESFEAFSRHVAEDRPHGVEKIPQYSGDTNKPVDFKQRYPHGQLSKIFLREESFIAEDEAFLICPHRYSDWLLQEAKNFYQDKLHIIIDHVTEVHDKETIEIKTLHGKNLQCNKVVFAGGAYNRFWQGLAPESHLKNVKVVQGSYLEFNDIDLKRDSFSLTFNGDNLIWSKTHKRLLVGSTSQEVQHFLPPKEELKSIYHRLSLAVDFPLPKFQDGKIKVGLREKARKREPYVIKNGNFLFLGGLYKNGFTLSLKMTRTLSHQHL